MAEAAKPAGKYEPPKELEQRAAVQKFQGRAKRVPQDQAEFFYSLKGMHILFFVSSLIMLISFVLMFVKDDQRPWKPYQIQYADMELERLWQELQKLENDVKVDRARLAAIDQQISSFFSKFETGRELKVVRLDIKTGKPLAVSPVETVHVRVGTDNAGERQLVIDEREALEGDHYDKSMIINTAKDKMGAIRYRYEEAKHHYEEAFKKQDPRLMSHKKHLTEVEELWGAVQKEVLTAKTAFDEVDSRKALLGDLRLQLESFPIAGVWEGKPLNALLKERIAIVRERDEKVTRYEREKPGFANTVRNQPMMDFFGPTLKVRQFILPDLRDQLNFVKVEKVDRCHTCHVGIDNPSYAVTVDRDAGKEVDQYRFKDPFLRGYVGHALGRIDRKECTICDTAARPKELPVPTVAHGGWDDDAAVKYTKALMAHPRLDLHVTGASKHPMDRFGCTTCHEGDGRDTDFTRVVHTPDSKEEALAWRRRHGTPFGEEKYNWHYRELWDLPMISSKFHQSSCRRCHQNEVELDGAPKYVTGMKIVERAGCYACHRTDSYQILPKDTSNPAIDANRAARRPGPPLTRIATKVSEEWAAKWVLDPRGFRPTTRMPHFFGQSNTRAFADKKWDPDYEPKVVNGVLRSPVEDIQAACMVKYIWSLSETNRDPDPPAAKGDAKKGEQIVQQVGCIGCHKTADAAYGPNESRFLKEFGPTLSGVGSKMNRAWLYQWVRDPKKHFKESLMPNFRLSEQDAVDVVEYLMSLRKPEWEKSPAPGAMNGKLLDDLILEQLKLKMPDVDAKRELESLPGGKVLWYGKKMVANFGCYSCHELKKDGDTDWANTEGIGVELTGSQPFGSKHHDRLDFGFAAVDGYDDKHEGVNHHGVTFKHGFTGVEVTAKVFETRQDWLAAKLKNPRVFDGGKMTSKPHDELLRMPRFDFNDYETEMISTFILSFTDHAVAGLVTNSVKRMNPDEVARNRGERVVRDSNCVACHRLSLDTMFVEWKRGSPEDKTKTMTSVVPVEGRQKAKLTGEDALTRLKPWGLTGDPKKVELYTFAWASDHRLLAHTGAVTPASEWVFFDGQDWWYLDVAEGKLVEKRPIVRREPMDGGEIIPHLVKYKRELFDTLDDPPGDMEDAGQREARFAPFLRSQGSKTQADWLFKFLKGPTPIRPNLAPPAPGAKAMLDVNLRMPTFDFTDEEAAAVVRWFAIRDHLKGADVYPHTDIPERGEARLKDRMAFLDKLIPALRKDCVSCHLWDGKAPNVSGADAYKLAPDFAIMSERLRPRWLQAWLADPASIYPGTTMTQYDFTPLFPGVPNPKAEGVQSSIEFIMNFHRLKPKE